VTGTLALVRLLQLASPTLPVGAYSYSQGLEAAVESGEVADAAGAQRWIGDVLALSLARMEAPLLARMMLAWSREDRAGVQRWNDEYVASRETAELRAETLQMGYSLARLVAELEPDAAPAVMGIEQPSFPAVFACAAACAGVQPREALAAYLFAWIENQALAALKSIPLGQTPTQALIRDLARGIPALVETALELPDEGLANFAPGLALASSRHETQYSRIFRS
jgi:urease accessory protein